MNEYTIEELYRLAKQGNTEALIRLGLYYKEGNRVEKDEVAAAKCFYSAASAGNAIGQYQLGVCFEQGCGIEQDFEKAAYWYHEAARQLYEASKLGNPQAQYHLAICYMEGRGVDPDESAAFYWYEIAAKQGYADAQYNLGYCYLCGIGVEQNEKEALKWYQKAADQGDPQMQHNLGLIYKDGYGCVSKNYGKAAEWFFKAARQGYSEAKVELAMIYFCDPEAEKDIAAAERLMTEAADAGIARAQEYLMHYYYDQHEDKKNMRKAYTYAACVAKRKEDATASLIIGLSCMQGKLFAKNEELGFKWLNSLAKRQDILTGEACFYLGKCYQEGVVTGKSYEKASLFYGYAMEKGCKEAELGLETLRQELEKQDIEKQDIEKTETEKISVITTNSMLQAKEVEVTENSEDSESSKAAEPSAVTEGLEHVEDDKEKEIKSGYICDSENQYVGDNSESQEEFEDSKQEEESFAAEKESVSSALQETVENEETIESENDDDWVFPSAFEKNESAKKENAAGVTTEPVLKSVLEVKDADEIEEDLVDYQDEVYEAEYDEEDEEWETSEDQFIAALLETGAQVTNTTVGIPARKAAGTHSEEPDMGQTEEQQEAIHDTENEVFEDDIVDEEFEETVSDVYPKCQKNAAEMMDEDSCHEPVSECDEIGTEMSAASEEPVDEEAALEHASDTEETKPSVSWNCTKSQDTIGKRLADRIRIHEVEVDELIETEFDRENWEEHPIMSAENTFHDDANEDIEEVYNEAEEPEELSEEAEEEVYDEAEEPEELSEEAEEEVYNEAEKPEELSEEAEEEVYDEAEEQEELLEEAEEVYDEAEKPAEELSEEVYDEAEEPEEEVYDEKKKIEALLDDVEEELYDEVEENVSAIASETGELVGNQGDETSRILKENVAMKKKRTQRREKNKKLTWIGIGAGILLGALLVAAGILVVTGNWPEDWNLKKIARLPFTSGNLQSQTEDFIYEKSSKESPSGSMIYVETESGTETSAEMETVSENETETATETMETEVVSTEIETVSEEAATQMEISTEVELSTEPEAVTEDDYANEVQSDFYSEVSLIEESEDVSEEVTSVKETLEEQNSTLEDDTSDISNDSETEILTSEEVAFETEKETEEAVSSSEGDSTQEASIEEITPEEIMTEEITSEEAVTEEITSEESEEIVTEEATSLESWEIEIEAFSEQNYQEIPVPVSGRVYAKLGAYDERNQNLYVARNTENRFTQIAEFAEGMNLIGSNIFYKLSDGSLYFVPETGGAHTLLAVGMPTGEDCFIMNSSIFCGNKEYVIGADPNGITHENVKQFLTFSEQFVFYLDYEGTLCFSPYDFSKIYPIILPDVIEQISYAEVIGDYILLYENEKECLFSLCISDRTLVRIPFDGVEHCNGLIGNGNWIYGIYKDEIVRVRPNGSGLETVVEAPESGAWTRIIHAMEHYLAVEYTENEQSYEYVVYLDDKTVKEVVAIEKQMEELSEESATLEQE